MSLWSIAEPWSVRVLLLVRKRAGGLALAAGLAASLNMSAPAADQTYDSANPSNTWDLTSQNWDGSTAPWINGNNAVFGGIGETVTVNGAPIVFNNLTFNSAGYTLADGTGSLSLANDLASTITVATGTATIAESIVNNLDGASALTKDGAGMLVLSADNTYSGTTTIRSGILSIASSRALGSASSGTTLLDGEIQISGNTITAPEPLTINSGFPGAALRNTSGNNTYSGPITVISSSRILSDSGTLILSADQAINGRVNVSGGGDIAVTGGYSASIVKDSSVAGGTGTLTLSGRTVGPLFTSVAVLAGTLKLDYSSDDTNKLYGLTLGGITNTVPVVGSLNTGGIVELAGGTHIEDVSGLFLGDNTATSTITRSSGLAVLQLNTITPNTGTGLIFNAPGIATTDNAIANGILGFWARMNVGGASSWATSAGAPDSPIVAFTGYTDVNRLGGTLPNAAANHIRVISGGTSGNLSLGGGSLTQAYTVQMSATDGPGTIQAAANTDVLNVGDNAEGAIWLTPNAAGLTIGSGAGNGVLSSGRDINAAPALLRLINDNSASNLVVNSILADNGTDVVSVTKSGIGTVVLNGNNTFTGTLNVAGGGTLTMTGNNSARTGSAANSTVVYGTLQLQANGGNTSGGVSTVLSSEQPISFTAPFALNFGGTLQLRSDSSVTFAGGNGFSIVGSSAFGGTGAATIDVRPVNSTETNRTLTFAPGGINSVSSASVTPILNVTGENGYRLNLGLITAFPGSSLTLNPTSASLTIAGFTVRGLGPVSGTSTLNLSGTATGNVVTGTISNAMVQTGDVTLAKTGSSSWDLQGANTYSQETSVQEGTLTLSGNRTASSGPISVRTEGTLNITNGNFSMPSSAFTVSGTVNQSGGSIMLGGDQLLVGNVAGGSVGTYSFSGGTLTAFPTPDRGVILGVNAGTTGVFNLSGTGNLALGSSALQIGRSSAVAINSTGIFNQTGGAASFGTLSVGGGPGTTNFGSSGTLNLTGGTFAAATFTNFGAADSGTANITIGGAAQVTLPAFPTARGVGASSTITFDGGTLIPAAASTTYLGGLTNAFLSANGARFDVPSGRDITVTQVLRNAPAQNGTLTKQGAGALTLAGLNTYSGSTTIQGGSLLVTGSLAGATIVNSGGTLGGSGKVESVTVANGGIIAPGVGIGTLTTGALNLNPASVLRFDLASPGVIGGTTNDLLSVAGSLTLDGTLQVMELAGFGDGTYRLLNYSGTLTNNQLDLESSFLAAHPASFIDSSTANQVNLVVLPEPGSNALLLGGLFGLLGSRFRGRLPLRTGFEAEQLS